MREKPIKMPSRVPRDYVERVLSRLLPPPSVVATLDAQGLRDYLRTKDELTHLVGTDPVRFFIPNPGGQYEFAVEEDKQFRVRCFFAGNKAGKTTIGAIKFCERLLGGPLWGRDWRTVSYPVPARGCVYAEDFDSHKEVTQPAIDSWLPPGVIKRKHRNSAGQTIQYDLSNGSLIHFRTYDQGPDKAEGKDYDIVWPDEPPPRDIYTAVFRGLVATDGILLITATLLKEVWLYDEMEQPHVKIYHADIHSNAYISQQAKVDFLASLTDDERLTRETGKPSSLSGVIYQSFQAKEPYVVEDVPRAEWESWPIVSGVDPHERRPIHMLYGYVDPFDNVDFFGYLLPVGSVQEIFAQIDEYESTLPSRPRLYVMDPNRGKARQIQIQTGAPASWQEIFEAKGRSVELGYDDVSFGHTKVRECFQLRKPQLLGQIEGAQGAIGSSPSSFQLDIPFIGEPRPRFRFFRSCLPKGGPIYQLLRYSWDDWQKGSRMEREKKEKPKDRNKDFPDIVRYLACYNPKFEILSYGYDPIDLAPPGWRNRAVRAYA